MLNAVLYLAERYYREHQFTVSKLNEELRANIVASTFNIRSPLTEKPPAPWTSTEVQQKKIRVVSGLQQAGIKVSDTTVLDYFSMLETISTTLDSKKKDPKQKDTLPNEYIQWIMNVPQINWIENVISQIETYNKQIDNTLKRIQAFQKSINSFFCDSHKEIEFDPSGEIIVKVRGSTIRADSLSSGETQLLTLLTYLFFGFQEGKEFVVMIDEPELSLHPKWQHQYVDHMLDANPKVQFILATHSPEIVQKRKTKCLQIPV